MHTDRYTATRISSYIVCTVRSVVSIMTNLLVKILNECDGDDGYSGDVQNGKKKSKLNVAFQPLRHSSNGRKEKRRFGASAMRRYTSAIN